MSGGCSRLLIGIMTLSVLHGLLRCTHPSLCFCRAVEEAEAALEAAKKRYSNFHSNYQKFRCAQAGCCTFFHPGSMHLQDDPLGPLWANLCDPPLHICQFVGTGFNSIGVIMCRTQSSIP